MKVIYDHPLFYYRYGGAPKYFAELMANIPKKNWENTALWNFDQYLNDLNLMKLHHFKFKGEYALLTGLNKAYTYYRIRRGKFDVFHQTNFDTYLLKVLDSKPMVTTYHDSNFSTYYYNPAMVERQKISLQRADAIITISQNTKMDLLKLFKVDEKKVFVIYHGIDLPSQELMNSPKIYKFPYILFVGRRIEYKNFRPFVKAYSAILRTYPELKLICTGSSFTKEECEYIKSLGIEKNVIHVSANEDTMKLLYRDAMLFAFPSKYEGFGMPILEAWSCHCPIALADASCFPEIAKDGAAYFDPESIDDIYATIKDLLDHEVKRKRLIEKGNQYVKEFSWIKTVRQHIKVYESLI